MVAAAPQPAPRTLDQMSAEERRLAASPYGFGRYFLGLPFSDCATERKVGECRSADGQTHFYDIFDNDRQRQVVDALDAEGAKVSARTCNGAGKTTLIIPTAVLWFMALHPRAKVVMTSGVERQVRGQLFPALKAHHRRLGGWKFNDADISAPNGSVAIGFSTNDGGRFEGWHGNKNPLYDLLRHDGPLMLVVDEAKSVAPTIFDAIDRCTFQRLLLASSCGGSLGQFYRSHHADARFFRRFALPSSHCPHADHAKNAELIEKRGITDPLVRSKVFAEFMSGVAGSVVKAEHLAAIRNNPPAKIAGHRRIFCDFAAGGDENVIALRDGNTLRIVAAWREANTTVAIGQFIDHLRRLGITTETCPQLVAADGDGLGKPILDRLDEIGWRMQRVHNNGTPLEPGYRNRSAEMWYKLAKAAEERRVRIEGMDDLLFAQLTERTGYTDQSGRLCLESKEDMRARGVDSPDRADALVGAAEDVESQLAPVDFATSRSDLSLIEQLYEQAGGLCLPGADAG